MLCCVVCLSYCYLNAHFHQIGFEEGIGERLTEGALVALFFEKMQLIGGDAAQEFLGLIVEQTQPHLT